MPKGAASPNSKQNVNAAKRQAQAIELRLAGLTLQQISDELGYAHRRGASQAIEVGLKKMLSVPAEQMRSLENHRIDALQASIWPKCLNGDLDAIRVCLQIMQRRARLNGLDLQLPDTQVNVGVLPGAEVNLNVSVPKDPDAQERLADHLREVEAILDASSPGEDTPALPG
ncbi:MAG: hypothetical protein OES13_00350 [Acidimicrobiia bacterium]|nr:hypothetical protein [Acidimicrobiia bacterium]